VIERASILAAAGEAILPEHLPPLGGDAASAMTRTPGAEPTSDGPLAIDTSIPLKEARERWVTELERRYLARLLAEHGDNVTVAARAAGVDRIHVHRLLRRHGLR